MSDRRHVWVHRPAANGDNTPTPGLLIEWQRRDDGWWANVATVSSDGQMVVSWRRAGEVRPA